MHTSCYTQQESRHPGVPTVSKIIAQRLVRSIQHEFQKLVQNAKPGVRKVRDLALSLSLSIYIYISIFVYVCIYMYIYIYLGVSETCSKRKTWCTQST